MLHSNPALWSRLYLCTNWIPIARDQSVWSRSVQDFTQLLSPAAWAQHPRSFCAYSCVYSASYMPCLNQSCAMTLLKKPTTSAKSTDSWADMGWLRLATLIWQFDPFAANICMQWLSKGRYALLSPPWKCHVLSDGPTSILVLHGSSSQCKPHWCPWHMCVKDRNCRRSWCDQGPAEFRREVDGPGLGQPGIFMELCTDSPSREGLSPHMLIRSSVCHGWLWQPHEGNFDGQSLKATQSRVCWHRTC